MANKKEFQQCEASTKDGTRCLHKGVNRLSRLVRKKFLWLFPYTKTEYRYYCTQHRCNTD